MKLGDKNGLSEKMLCGIEFHMKGEFTKNEYLRKWIDSWQLAMEWKWMQEAESWCKKTQWVVWDHIIHDVYNIMWRTNINMDMVVQ